MKSSNICLSKKLHYPHVLAVNKLYPLMDIHGICVEHRKKLVWAVNQEPYLNENKKRHCCNKTIMNDLFANCFADRVCPDGEGNANFDPQFGEVTGGKIICVIDDSRAATVSYNKEIANFFL